MEALAGIYASSDSDAETGHAASPRPCKRTRRVEEVDVPRQLRLSRRPRRNEERGAWRQALLRESLSKLQHDSSRWPSASLAAQRKAGWEWFTSVCSSEFAPELLAQPQVIGRVEEGLRMFGSDQCNMWVPDSDMDCNMWTRNRIPMFFARLKKALMAADPAAHVEIVAGARVPVAKVRARGQQFDVTHEYGEGNAIAHHHMQVLAWAQQWSRQDPAISIAIRVIKLWAATKKVNNPSRATLNSLGYLVMLLALPACNEKTCLSSPSSERRASCGGGEQRGSPGAKVAACAAAAQALGAGAEGENHETGVEAGEGVKGGGSWRLIGEEGETVRALHLLHTFFASYAAIGTPACSKVILAPSGAIQSEVYCAVALCDNAFMAQKIEHREKKNLKI